MNNSVKIVNELHQTRSFIKRTRTRFLLINALKVLHHYFFILSPAFRPTCMDMHEQGGGSCKETSRTFKGTFEVFQRFLFVIWTSISIIITFDQSSNVVVQQSSLLITDVGSTQHTTIHTATTTNWLQLLPVLVFLWKLISCFNSIRKLTFFEKH